MRRFRGVPRRPAPGPPGHFYSAPPTAAHPRLAARHQVQDHRIMPRLARLSAGASVPSLTAFRRATAFPSRSARRTDSHIASQGRFSITPRLARPLHRRPHRPPVRAVLGAAAGGASLRSPSFCSRGGVGTGKRVSWTRPVRAPCTREAGFPLPKCGSSAFGERRQRRPDRDQWSRTRVDYQGLVPGFLADRGSHPLGGEVLYLADQTRRVFDSTARGSMADPASQGERPLVTGGECRRLPLRPRRQVLFRADAITMGGGRFELFTPARGRGARCERPAPRAACDATYGAFQTAARSIAAA